VQNANNHIMHTDNTGQIAGVDTDGNQQPEGTTKHQITPAKRQKWKLSLKAAITPCRWIIRG
jgi:hypothetical protein